MPLQVEPGRGSSPATTGHPSSCCGARRRRHVASIDPTARLGNSGVNALNRGISNWEANYQATTPNTTAACLGATAGEVAPLLVDAPVKGMTALADHAGPKVASDLPAFATKAAPAVAKVVGGAAQVATVGAVPPVASPAPTLTDLATRAGCAGSPGYRDQKLGHIERGDVWRRVRRSDWRHRAGYSGVANAVRTSPLLNPQRYAGGQVAAQLGTDALGRDQWRRADACRHAGRGR